MFGIKHISYDEADKFVAEVGADVGREVSDPWVDALSFDNLRELVNRVGFIHPYQL